MKDCEKILLLVSVGTYNLSPTKAVEKFNEVKEHFTQMFDESYKIVCYPEITQSKTHIRLYNPNSPKQNHICQIPEDASLDELREL